MQEKFCGKCGRPLDTATGKCPVCDKYQTIDADEAQMTVAPVPVVAEKKDTKISEGKKTALIVSAIVLVFAVALTGILIAVLKKDKQPEKKLGNEEVEAVETTYITYLNEHLIPEMGVFKEDGISTNPNGIKSVSFVDVNRDGVEEMIVAVSQTENNAVSDKFICYKYDENAEKKVSQTGDFTLYSDNGEFSRSKLSFNTPASELYGNNSSAFYTVEYEGKTYFVYEYVTAVYSEAEGVIYSEEAHVLTFEDGQLREVGNLTVDGLTGVYSKLVPSAISIDNSDLPQYFAEDNYLESVCQKGYKVLFYDQWYQDMGGVEYRKYYDSTDSAEKAFFACFGINRESTVRYIEPVSINRYITLTIPENAKPIFTYDLWAEGNGRKCEFKDFSALKELIASKESTTASTAPAVTETKKAADTNTVTPEQAVDIYYNSLPIWHVETDDYFDPDRGARYTFLDLDFDGINELAVSNVTDSDLTAENAFYKIDKASKKVVKIPSADERCLNNTAYLMNGNELYLVKGSQGKMNVYYFSGEYLPNGGAGCSQTDFGVFCLESGKVKTEMKFWETYLAAGVIPYMGAEENGDGPFDTDTFSYGYYQNNTMEETDKAAYDKMKNSFLSEHSKTTVSFKVLDGKDFDASSASEQKAKLLDSYKSFSHK